MMIIDGFLKQKEMISTLKNNKTWIDFPSLNWWEGWWKSEPRNIMELLIKMIWSTRGVENKIAGFEYWSNYGKKPYYLDWHADKDEGLFIKNKNFTMATVGSIYYIESNNLDGGYLEISNLPLNVRADPLKIERVQAVENRLIIMNPSKPHRVTEIISGERRAFLTNIWFKKPMTFEKSENVSRSSNLGAVHWPNKFSKY